MSEDLKSRIDVYYGMMDAGKDEEALIYLNQHPDVKSAVESQFRGIVGKYLAQLSEKEIEHLETIEGNQLVARINAAIDNEDRKLVERWINMLKNAENAHADELGLTKKIIDAVKKA